MTMYNLPDPKDFENNINGKNTHLFTLTNRAGMQIALSDYGARLISALVPDKNGELIDVVLGFSGLDNYLNAKEQYHGATIGRYANRINNGEFNLEERTYTLDKNNNSNALHGGPEGFHRKVWDRQISFKKQVDFYYISSDKEEGYPGNLNVHLSYELTNDNAIHINFHATTDKTTVVNLTNHAYFNLKGEGNGDVLNHILHIPSSEFIPINEKQIPTGKIQSVDETVFDFRNPRKIVDGINSDEEQIQFANGYDHTYVNTNPISQPAATAYSEESGIVLEIYTNYPGIHLYSGNFLSADEGKSGNHYLRYGGFCFEAQNYPDSPNQKDFPSVILHPGESLDYSIIYKFGIKK